MCWCTPEIRTPNCGKMGCHPPSRYSEGFQDGLKSAIKEVQGWRDLQILSHKNCPYADPTNAQREHENTLRLLDVIMSKISKKESSETGSDPGEK